MRILILSWRDTRNPAGGGAEILTHELAKRWTKKGHYVTQFSSFFSGAKQYEEIDGVNIIRRGHSDARAIIFSVHFLAFLYYMKYGRGKFDVVIDEIHGLPFFTPFYVRERKIAFICEVASDLWFKMYGPIFGGIGRLIEIIYLRIIYRNVTFMTISKSSKEELIKNGVSKSKTHVLPMGINVPPIRDEREKEKIPTLLYIGRLSKAKGIEDALRTVNILKEKGQSIRLKIIGRGDKKYVDFLHTFCKKLNILSDVDFLGFVSEKKKFETISSSHILISPSIKEGFGLTIPEAGYMGVPSVVYNSLGLLDIVVDHKNGLICKKNTPEDLAKAIILLLQNTSLYKKLSDEARRESVKYDWDKTARIALQIIS